MSDRSPQEAAPKLMTLKEVAEHFNVSEKTVTRMPLVFTKIGGQRRYHPAIIKHYEVMRASSPLSWKSVA